MIIDFHTHIYPENVANKILPAAEKKLNIKVPCTGSPQDLRSRMHKSGIDISIVLPLAKGQEDVSSLNDWVRSVSGAGLTTFGAIHPLMDNLEDELDRLISNGVKGVKMMPLLQMVYPDDPRCDRLYEAVIQRDMILVTHAGRDPLDRDEVFGTPERFAKVVESYPELKLILAHLGGLRMWDNVRKYLLPVKGNVRFDTSYAYFYIQRKEMTELIHDFGTDRVLFGSDYPWEDPGRAVDIIKSLDLSENEIDSLLWKNGAELLGVEK
ncbi:MAG: amidohydrolase family protein [Methanotrichaceae archaeon]